MGIFPKRGRVWKRNLGTTLVSVVYSFVPSFKEFLLLGIEIRIPQFDIVKPQWDHWDANIFQTATSLETTFGHNVGLIKVLIRAKFDGIPITGGRDKNPAVCHG